MFRPIDNNLPFNQNGGQKPTKEHFNGKLVPVCAWCNSVRDSHGQWHHLEATNSILTSNNVTHTICDSCKSEFTRQMGLTLAPVTVLR